MKRSLAILVSAAIFALCCCSSGRKPHSPYRNCAETVSDRLSNPSVTCFCLDSAGRMWIGTERGLNRFNGYDFHQYFFSGDSAGLPGNYISDIAIDGLGRLWAGTEDGVALYTQNGTFQRIPVISKEKAVYQILCSANGNVYLNMMEDLCVLSPGAKSFESKIPNIDRYHSYCQRCYLDRRGRLWSVASLELRCFDAESLVNLENYSTLQFVVTSALLSNGEIWMWGKQSLSIFDTETDRYKELPAALSSCKALMQQDIEFISEADSAHVLLKTADGQMFCYDFGNRTLEQLSFSLLRIPSDFALKGLHKDSSGRLWLASDNSGFLVRPPLGDLSRSGLSTGELDSASIVSISQDGEGNIWLFSLHDGLFRYEASTGRLSKPDLIHRSQKDKTTYLHKNHPLVLADSASCIWMAYPDQRLLMKGLYGNGKIRVVEEYTLYYPKVAICDSDGSVWIGTFNYYVHHAAPGGGSLKQLQVYPAQTTQITCLLEYGDYLLVGAYNEPLMLVDRHSFQTQLLPVSENDYSACTSNGFFYPTVLRLDSAGDILIGTRFNGLLKYDSESGRMHKMAGVPDTDISSVEVDTGGNIWVSTPGGLFVYNPSEASWHDYYSTRIQGDTYFYDRASLGSGGAFLLFGTSQGIVVVNPGEKASMSNSRLYFEDIKLFNKTYAWNGTGPLVLGYRDKQIGITFAAPDYLNVGEIRYKYLLEGAGNSWTDLGSGREIYLNDLRTGKYRLRVCHYIGQDTLHPEASADIVVKPHPLLSVPAILLYLILFAFASVFIWRARRKVLDQKRSAMQAEFEKEQEKRINRMNMTFFSNVSHEFRTPLTMISGPVNQLGEEPGLTGKGKYLLSLVRTNVDRMLSLVNQLMDVSKLENSTLSLKVVRADIVPCLEECMAIFKVNAESLGIRITERGLEYPLVTWFDSDKVQKILSNLMSNALKFTPKGGTVSLELDEQVQDGVPLVRITVSDTGNGIPQDKLEKIFDRYYQLDNKGSGKIGQGGTGIGLYYARSLATVHHGSLTAFNSDGGGASFTLLIPKAESAYSSSEKTCIEPSVAGRLPLETVPEMTADGAAPADAGQLPVLLAVDDDPDIVRYLVSLFSSHYRVIPAHSAEESLALALADAPDVILSDVAMPGKDGFEFCREIKQDLQLCHIPVILVTAMGALENQVHGLDEGADAYVTKPFDPTYLQALVRSQLENRRRVQNIVNSATGSSSLEAVNAKDRAFLEQLYSLMDAELSDEDLDIATLASKLNISRTKFYYKMKGLTGKSPSDFFMQYKLNIAAKLLIEGKLNVSEIAIKTGFTSLAHFSKSFKKQFGVSPSKYTG